jgi:hypothetical protein
LNYGLTYNVSARVNAAPDDFAGALDRLFASQRLRLPEQARENDQQREAEQKEQQEKAAQDRGRWQSSRRVGRAQARQASPQPLRRETSPVPLSHGRQPQAQNPTNTNPTQPTHFHRTRQEAVAEAAARKAAEQEEATRRAQQEEARKAAQKEEEEKRKREEEQKRKADLLNPETPATKAARTDLVVLAKLEQFSCELCVFGHSNGGKGTLLLRNTGTANKKITTDTVVHKFAKDMELKASGSPVHTRLGSEGHASQQQFDVHADCAPWGATRR